MPEALTVEGSLNEQLIAHINEFAALSDKSLREDMTKQGKELAEQLFICAPRAIFSQIKAKLTTLGWKFKRPPRGALRRYLGHKTNAINTTDGATKAARQKRRELFNSLTIKRKGRESSVQAQMRYFAENPAAAKEWYGALKPTLAEVQDATARYRGDHIGYIASTFIPAMRQLGSTMRAASGDKRIKLRPMSKVIFEGGDSHIEITIINSAPGVAKVAAVTGFVDTAINNRIVDIDTYIQRKKEEIARVWEAVSV